MARASWKRGGMGMDVSWGRDEEGGFAGGFVVAGGLVGGFGVVGGGTRRERTRGPGGGRRESL